MIRREAISAALSRTDPYKLIDQGAPHDEYDFEAKMIDAELSRKKELTTKLIIDVFEHSFRTKIKDAKPFELAYLEIQKAIE